VAAFERNFIRHWEGYIEAKFLMLPLEGLHVKQDGRSRSYFTTDSQSVCLGVEHPCGACDQILLPVLSEICGLISDERTGLPFAVCCTKNSSNRRRHSCGSLF
jgi:hypothetical protein